MPGELRLDLEFAADPLSASTVPPPSIGGMGISWEFIRSTCAVSLAHHLRALVNLLGALRAIHTDVSRPPKERFHGSVSPLNLLFKVDGSAMLAESGDERLAQCEVYLAPEARTGRVDQQSDIYAVGVMLLEVITNRRLYPPDLRDICTVRHEVHPFWSPFVRDPLLQVGLRALAPVPMERWRSARDFYDAILACGGGRVAPNHEFQSMISSTVRQQADRATPVADSLAVPPPPPAPVLEIEPDEIEEVSDWGTGTTLQAMPAVMPPSTRRVDDPSISQEMPRVVVDESVYAAGFDEIEERTSPQRSLLAGRLEADESPEKTHPGQATSRGARRGVAGLFVLALWGVDPAAPSVRQEHSATWESVACAAAWVVEGARIVSRGELK